MSQENGEGETTNTSERNSRRKDSSSSENGINSRGKNGKRPSRPYLRTVTRLAFNEEKVRRCFIRNVPRQVKNKWYRISLCSDNGYSIVSLFK